MKKFILFLFVVLLASCGEPTAEKVLIGKKYSMTTETKYFAIEFVDQYSCTITEANEKEYTISPNFVYFFSYPELKIYRDKSSAWPKDYQGKLFVTGMYNSKYKAITLDTGAFLNLEKSSRPKDDSKDEKL